jgi:hypothetical protein
MCIATKAEMSQALVRSMPTFYERMYMLTGERMVRQPRERFRLILPIFMKFKNCSAKGYKENRAGFSLLEMLIYVGLFSFFMIIAVNASIIMTGAYARARTAKLLDSAAVNILSKIAAEARQSSAINALSTLGVSPGHLILEKSLDTGTEEVEFYIGDGRLIFERNNEAVGGITSPGVQVNSLVFRKIDSVHGQALKVELSLTASKGGETKSETFYQTVVLRGSYQ